MDCKTQTLFKNEFVGKPQYNRGEKKKRNITKLEGTTTATEIIHKAPMQININFTLKAWLPKIL